MIDIGVRQRQRLVMVSRRERRRERHRPPAGCPWCVPSLTLSPRCSESQITARPMLPGDAFLSSGAANFADRSTVWAIRAMCGVPGFGERSWAVAVVPHRIRIDGPIIQTGRLTLRPWQLTDAEEALEIFGAEDVRRWLAPGLDPVSDISAMRARLSSWQSPAGPPPLGHWAVVDQGTDQLVGSGQIIPLPPENRDLLIGYEIRPSQWGHGFGTEAGHALAHYAFQNGQTEIFAVVRSRNERAKATARKIGMEWVGETEKYFGLRLHVYRLRPGDLDRDPLDPGPVA